MPKLPPKINISGAILAMISRALCAPQLIKNAIVGNQDTILRKLEEIILAPQISRYYTKQQILSMYLNTIYYGEQAYGADAAAFTYFDLQDTANSIAASQLDIAQAAMLAGIPSSPS